jgi:hypothetical protein
MRKNKIISTKFSDKENCFDLDGWLELVEKVVNTIVRLYVLHVCSPTYLFYNLRSYKMFLYITSVFYRFLQYDVIQLGILQLGFLQKRSACIRRSENERSDLFWEER